MIYRLLLALLLGVSIWGLYSARQRKAAERQRDSEVITAPEPVVGFAIRDSTGRCCVVTARADVKPGWDLRLFWPHEHATAEATLGELRSPCTIDIVASERSFALAGDARLPRSEPTVVLGRMFWSVKDSAYVGEFDSKPGQDRIAACRDGEYLHLFVMNDGPSGTASFYRRLPAQSADDCTDDMNRIIEQRMPLEPLLYPE